MKVLIIGKGGREHAIVKAVKMSPKVSEVHVIPGGDGFALDGVLNHDIAVSDTVALVDKAQKLDIDFVIIGPEDPLAEGLADQLTQVGIKTFGPQKKAAQLEASKIVAKEYMQEFGVPTAKFQLVDSVESVLENAKLFTPPYVLKADGLAAGKGVIICKDLYELKTAAENMFEKKILGDAGSKALLEEFQAGWEMSYLVLTNGEDFQPLVLSQDHKRLLENDEGPNTGGMGVVAPLNIDDELNTKIIKTIIEPSIAGLKARDFDYKGVLYIGLMITESGPTVIEYNVRFGDPEAQVILPLLHGDWAEVFYNVACGKLTPLDWKPLASACVVLASEGYPENPKKNIVIRGDILSQTASSYFLHAGTKKNENGDWVTDGGRVLNSVAVGSSLKEALDSAYKQAATVTWPGMQMRKDIGKKVL